MYTITPLELKAAAQKLPPSPRIFGKIGRLLRNRNTGIKDIATLVNTDSSLTAQVLRISNSAAFSSGVPIDNLDEAINRIGFGELFKVVGMAAASNTFTGRSPTYGVDGSLIWENAVASGLAMECLAAAAGQDGQQGYTLGLLRSIGKLVLDNCSRCHSVPPRFLDKYGMGVVEWEQQTFGLTNPRVASLVLTAWKLPSLACQAIEYQYAPEIVPNPNPYCRLLNVANGVAERVGKALPGEGGYWDLGEEALEQVSLEEAQVDEACDYVSQKMEEVVGALA